MGAVICVFVTGWIVPSSLTAVFINGIIAIMSSLYIYRWYETRRQLASRLASILSSEQIFTTWKPQPLQETTSKDINYFKPFIMSNNEQYINFLGFDYLGLSNNKAVKIAAKNGILQYNAGSANPRLFYGTMDVHIDLENSLTEHFEGGNIKSKTTVIYSEYVSVPPSIIKCFVKKGDVLLIDEDCQFLLQLGAKLSKANIIYYKHNDLNSFKQGLEQSYKYKKCKRFIVTEGIFHNSGDICNLKEMVKIIKKLKQKHFLILDDTHAFGVLHALGSVGYHGLDISDIDIYLSSMETALGCPGGFCVVDKELDLLQRTTSNASIFSASSPPFTTVAAKTALMLLKKNEKDLCDQIQGKAKLMRSELLKKLSECWYLDGNHDNVPVIHLRFKADNNMDHESL